MSKSIVKSRLVVDDDAGAGNYQIIRDSKGAPEYVLVPWADFSAKASSDNEDVALIAAGNAARHDETFPAEVAARLIAGETPLKVFREWRGLTQMILAGRANMPVNYISQLERRDGGRQVGRKAAARLAIALGVSQEALMEL